MRGSSQLHQFSPDEPHARRLEWNTPLLTDLYELTMLHVYHRTGMDETAVFEFFVRKLPDNRHFLVAAGLEPALQYLEDLQFTAEEIGWLAGTGRYDADFIASLEAFRFTGDVHAMREGTVFFPDEPVLRVTAPIAQAQLVESRLVNVLHVSTLVATKAARCVLAAPDKLLVDFGMRRAHGFEAALAAARASYLAGFSGTATVLAEKLYGIPSYGTMAHSFVQAHASEGEAFARFARSEPGNVVLLIDTYDTLAAAHRVVDLARILAKEGIRIKAVRIDSGDLVELSRRVREILDAGNCPDIGIFASGGLDEYALRDLGAAAAPIDGFGIGTSLGVSADAPYLDCVYKLQEYAGVARRKRSAGKSTWPGRKQIYRHYRADQTLQCDILTTRDDRRGGEPLIAPVMRHGVRLSPAPTLASVRSHAQEELARLPAAARGLDGTADYPVAVSEALRALTAAVDRRFR